MQRIDTPPAFAALADIGGVLDVAVFRDSNGTIDEIIAGVPQALPWSGPFDGNRLRALGGRRIDRKTLLGDWADASGSLIRRGSWRTEDGRDLENPRLKALADARIVSGAAPLPEPGDGSQLAYAVLCPPYPLTAAPAKVQALFDAICAALLPNGQDVEILDWSSRELGEVSGYFKAGLEWWGVFLFSVYVPISRRLTLLAASATD